MFFSTLIEFSAITYSYHHIYGNNLKKKRFLNAYSCVILIIWNDQTILFYFCRYFGGIPLRISYTKDLSWYIKTLLSVICLEKVIYGIFILLIVLKASSISFWKKAQNNFIITGTWIKWWNLWNSNPHPSVLSVISSYPSNSGF